MSDLRTAAQQALEAWQSHQHGKCSLEEAVERFDALRAALAQQAEPVEPVAWECEAGGLKPLTQRQYDAQTANIRRHYTRIAPPQRNPLTKESLLYIYNQLPNWGMDMDSLPQGLEKFARAVERAHGIKE